MRNHTPRGKPQQKGVVIIEAMIAILIFSVGVLGIVGMQANMVRNTSESKFRSDASYIAQQRIGTLWVSPAMTDGATTNSDIDELPNGTVTITRTGDQYTVIVNWQQPGEEPHRYTTVANISGN